MTTSALRPLTGATWSDARTTCQPIREEISLYISTSQDETNFTRVLVRNQQTAKLSVRGLDSYRNTDNVFYWINDTPLAGQYSAWKSGERYSHNLNDGKCVYMYTLNTLAKKKKTRMAGMTVLACNFSETYSSRAPVALCQKQYI